MKIIGEDSTRKGHRFKLERKGFVTKYGRNSTLGKGIPDWNKLSADVFTDPRPLPSVREFRLRICPVGQE
jgi:hypothetical protein